MTIKHDHKYIDCWILRCKIRFAHKHCNLRQCIAIEHTGYAEGLRSYTKHLEEKYAD